MLMSVAMLATTSMAVRTVRKYDTERLSFSLEVRYAGTVRHFCNGTVPVRWCAV